MELKELRQKIKDSGFTETLNELEVTVDLPHIGESYRLIGLYNIYKFFLNQRNNWNVETLVLHENLFRDSINFFNAAVAHLDSFITNYVGNVSYSADNLLSHFHANIARFLRPTNAVFTANAPAVDFLIDLHAKDVEYFAPAFNYIIGNSVSVNSKKSITPLILTYEFENRDNSQIFNRREAEKKSFGKLKSEISTLGNSYENEITRFLEKTESDYQDYRTSEDKRIDNSRNTLRDWLVFQRENYQSFLQSTNVSFQKLFDNTSGEFEKLQNQYRELLKLEEPVKYWKDRAKELNKKATDILYAIYLISLLFAFGIYLLLWFTPEGLLETIFGGDKTKAIRWSFVFLILVSIFFVVIRALLKYMFSNFHLARDAEEREKLTYLYISLLSKGNISEEERIIVFQSLFSRSDTGLLKEDSSPTMPGISSILEKNLK